MSGETIPPIPQEIRGDKPREARRGGREGREGQEEREQGKRRVQITGGGKKTEHVKA